MQIEAKRQLAGLIAGFTDFKKKLKEMDAGGVVLPKSEWIDCGDIRAYVRRKVVCRDENCCFVFCISNIEFPVDLRGQGVFTAFLSEVERNLDNMFVGVELESVLNKRLEQYLSRNGYVNYGKEYNSLSCDFQKFIASSTVLYQR